MQPVLGAGGNHVPNVPRLVEPCDACGEPIPKTAVEIEGPIIKGAVVKFHVRCFALCRPKRKREANKGRARASSCTPAVSNEHCRPASTTSRRVSSSCPTSV